MKDNGGREQKVEGTRKARLERGAGRVQALVVAVAAGTGGAWPATWRLKTTALGIRTRALLKLDRPLSALTRPDVAMLGILALEALGLVTDFLEELEIGFVLQ